MVTITFAWDCYFFRWMHQHTSTCTVTQAAAPQPVSFCFVFFIDVIFVEFEQHSSVVSYALISITSKLPVVCYYIFFLLLCNESNNYRASNGLRALIWFFCCCFGFFLLSARCYTIKQVPLEKNSTNLTCLYVANSENMKRMWETARHT